MAAVMIALNSKMARGGHAKRSMKQLFEPEEDEAHMHAQAQAPSVTNEPLPPQNER